MIIWGWGGGTPKPKGDVAPVSCPNCGREVFYQHVSVTSWFRLYFIPVVPYKTRHLLLCPVCTRGAELSSGQLSAVERMKDATQRWRSHLVNDSDFASDVDAFWAGLFDTLSSSPAQVVPPTPAPPLDSAHSLWS